MKIIIENLRTISSVSILSGQPTRIAQEPWYLQLVSKNNYVYQTDDYEFILPGKSLLTINHVFIPPYVQRINPVLKNTNNASFFIPNEIITQFPCGMLSFSQKLNNISPQFTEHTRTNYFLKLDKNYEDLSKNYNNGHKLNLKQAVRENILVSKSNDIQAFVDHYQIHSHADIPRAFKKREMISSLVAECLNRNSGVIYMAESQKKEVLACAFLTIYNNRMVYLLSSSSREGKSKYAMFAIINEIIKSHCNSNFILDFEGSMIPGIAYFMKGFGADEENYYVYEWNEHWICRMKKKLKRLF